MYRHYDLKMSCTKYIFIIYTFLTVLYTYEIKKQKTSNKFYCKVYY